MRVKAVCHGCDHHPGNKDHHAKWDGATVTGEFGSPCGSCQLAFAHQRDSCDPVVIVVAFLQCGTLRTFGAPQDVFDRLVRHLVAFDLILVTQCLG